MNNLPPGISQKLSAALGDAGAPVQKSLQTLKTNPTFQKIQSTGMKEASSIVQTGVQSARRAWTYLSGPQFASQRANIERFVRPQNVVQRFQEMQRSIRQNNPSCRSWSGKGFHSMFGSFNFGPGKSGFSNFPGNTGSSSPGGSGSNFPGSGLGGDMLNKMLEWCSVSHAQSIAKEMNINMKNIKFDVHGHKVTVTIDAPEATPLQIEALGRRVEEECPMARFYGKKYKEMKWQKALTA